MKHWGELNDLETAIIRVGEFKNLFKLLVAGVENDTDIKVLQSAIYTMEGMLDDIDSTLYEKFQTVFDAVRDEDEDAELFEELEEEYQVEIDWPFDNMNSTSENQGSTVQINSTSEEDEAFKDLEKAMKNWHTATP